MAIILVASIVITLVIIIIGSRITIIIRGAPDKLSGRIIRPDSRFLHYPVSGRIASIIRPDSQIVFLTKVALSMSHPMHGSLPLPMHIDY